MKLTLEELKNLPLHRLRNIDIATREEELLVQSVIDEKLLALPVVGNPLVFPISMTDNMTAEKEAELQAKMDKHNAENRALVEARYEEETTVPEPEIVVEPVVEPIVEPEPTPEPVAKKQKKVTT